ncbi:hypothetical protein E2C01_092335 [Portunus trituberculatus]|uniref:Uncharacterized protein n=1 Tax=Portunus trituberculatus TaxID=210409 RepID=A0A5B7JV71_PORTR|nr:hypothetical protein [Portunus trituberculatus]
MLYFTCCCRFPPAVRDYSKPADFSSGKGVLEQKVSRPAVRISVFPQRRQLGRFTLAHLPFRQPSRQPSRLRQMSVLS